MSATTPQPGDQARAARPSGRAAAAVAGHRRRSPRAGWSPSAARLHRARTCTTGGRSRCRSGRRSAGHVDLPVAASRRPPRLPRRPDRPRLSAEEPMAAARQLQAQIDIDAPPAKVWALVSDLQPDAAVEPAVPADEGVRPLRAGAKTVNLNRRDFMFWPTTCQRHRGRSGAEAGVPGQREQHGLELRTRADRGRHPAWSRPGTPTNGSKPVVEPAGQRGDRRCAQLRGRTRRGHERVTAAASRPPRERSGAVAAADWLGQVEHAVVERVEQRRPDARPAAGCPNARRSRTHCRRRARRPPSRWRTPRTSCPANPPAAGRSRSRGRPAGWRGPSPSRARNRRRASAARRRRGPTG